MLIFCYNQKSPFLSRLGINSGDKTEILHQKGLLVGNFLNTNVMRYELFYLVGESKEPKLDSIKEEVKNIVIQEGGVFQEPQISEKRKMSYMVKGEIRGNYIAERFDLPKKDQDKNKEENKIQNITKKMNLGQDVLRFMIVNACELPELKSREAVIREKPAIASFRKKEEKKPISDKAATGEKIKETKSIDEKLEEILNI